MDWVFALLLLAVLAVLLLLWVDAERSRALHERLADRIVDAAPREEGSLWRDAANLLQVSRMQELLERSPLTRRLSRLLVLGDLSIGLGPLVLAVLGTSVLAAGIAYLLHPRPWVPVALLVAVPVAAWLALDAQARRRVQRRERQLPSFVTQMLSSLQTGSTPLASLQAASRVTADPLGRSLRELLDTLQLGVAPTQAWKDWARRCGGTHADLIATGVRLKWEAGGQMSSMLSHILESMLTRERLVLRVGTVTAQARLGSYVLGLLPVAFLLFSYTTNPRIFQFMLADPIGEKALWIGAALMGVGFLWLRRLSRLEF